MVICRYFQQGTCKFGSACNFEHPTGYNNQANQYKYVSSSYQQQQNKPTSSSYSKPTKAENDTLIKLVSEDVSQWINSSQWKLSCYSPFQGSYNPLTMFEDISPEEARFQIYLSKKNHNFYDVTNQIRQKNETVKDHMRKMINPDSNMRNQLINFNEQSYALKNTQQTNQTKPVAVFGGQQSQTSTFGNQAASPNLFASLINKTNAAAPQATNPLSSLQTNTPNKNTNLFGNLITNSAQNTNIFQQASPHNTNVFQSPITQTGNIFQQNKTPNIFQSNPVATLSTNTFQSPPNAGQNLFQQQNTTPATNIFAQNTAQAVNPFQTSANTTPQTNLFAQLAQSAPNPFQQSSAQNQNTATNQGFTSKIPVAIPKPALPAYNGPNYYSKQEDLKENDLQEFQSTNFVLGKIPSQPPTREMCY